MRVKATGNIQSKDSTVLARNFNWRAGLLQCAMIRYRDPRKRVGAFFTAACQKGSGDMTYAGTFTKRIAVSAVLLFCVVSSVFVSLAGCGGSGGRGGGLAVR